MEMLDVGLVLYMLVHTLSGIRRGLIHVIGSMVGMIAGAFIALHYSLSIAAWFAKLTGFDIQQLGKWVMFLVVFVVTSQLIGFLFWLGERALGFMVHLPFINSINHILGGLLAFFEGAFFVGIALYYAKFLPVPGLDAAMKVSKFTPWFIKISQVFLPLIPDVIKEAMKGLI